MENRSFLELFRVTADFFKSFSHVEDKQIVLHSCTVQMKPQQVSDGKQGTVKVCHCILATCAAQDEEQFDLMEEEGSVKINRVAFTGTTIKFLSFMLHYSWNRLLPCLGTLNKFC
ncbi:hypothetical protein GOODEAATRI_025252 [Goodea atripinnis]|uniref:Uncharacterized protein n=1 Tax=Goodea atripinnis TaxID=208336 RepID=A0ABV0P7N8_9TELE